MSIKYLNAAFEVKSMADGSTMKSGKKFVLIALADFADAHGIAYPSLLTLQKKTNFGRDTVISAIDELTEDGFIAKISNKHIPADHLIRDNQNCYKIDLDLLVENSYQSKKSTSRKIQPDTSRNFPPQPVEIFPDTKYSIKPPIEPSYKPEKENIEKKVDLPEELEPKKITLPCETEMRLDDNLLAWGYAQHEKWLTDEMQQHFAFFLDYLKNRKSKYKDWRAAFRNCVRGNWAKVRKGQQIFKSSQERLLEGNQSVVDAIKRKTENTNGGGYGRIE